VQLNAISWFSQFSEVQRQVRKNIISVGEAKKKEE